MTDSRKDNRNRDPQNTHRVVFMGGWTDAVNGRLYASTSERKTHANMGNLFGWIFGSQSSEFKAHLWELYLDNALDIEDN
jgi:hypothetical protein